MTASIQEQDVLLIVGGNFTPDALGPKYEEIKRRVVAAPQQYLQAFERLFLAGQVDVRVQSKLHPVAFLGLLQTAAPEQVRGLADRVLTHLNNAMALTDHAGEGALESLPEETSRIARRIAARRRELEALIRSPSRG